MCAWASPNAASADRFASMIGPVRWARSGEANIAYRMIGDGPVDLVFLGGLVSHVEVMLEEPGIRRWFERLGAIARVILVDRLGSGLSDPSPPSWDSTGEAEDVLAVLDDAQLERVVIFGYAAATPAAVELAASHPDRVLALIMYSPVFRMLAREAPLHQQWQRSSFRDWGNGDSLGVLAPSVAHVPQLREWLGRMERQSITPAGLERLLHTVERLDVRDRLSAIKAPTLLMYRQGDRYAEASEIEHAADRIEQARVIELPGSDSLPMVGDTEAMLAEIEEFLTGKRSGVEADRRLITLVITDVVEATSRLARLGDARWRDLLAAHDEAIRREVDRFGGRVVKTVGDSFVVAFDGLPSIALRATREIVLATKRLNVDIRVGVHTGECELIEGGDVGGLAVHIASRICDLASAGEVLASPSTYGTTVGSDLVFDDRGSHELRGVPFAWPLFALDG